MQEWNYTTEDSRGWTPGGCLLVLLMIIVFWLAVIGGGLWLGDNLTDILEGVQT